MSPRKEQINRLETRYFLCKRQKALMLDKFENADFRGARDGSWSKLETKLNDGILRLEKEIRSLAQQIRYAKLKK